MDYLRFFLPSALMSFGAYLQARDSNRTGADDGFGQVLSAAAPGIGLALEPAGPNQTRAMVRVMTAIRDAAQGYLDQNPSV